MSILDWLDHHNPLGAQAKWRARQPERDLAKAGEDLRRRIADLSTSIRAESAKLDETDEVFERVMARGENLGSKTGKPHLEVLEGGK